MFCVFNHCPVFLNNMFLPSTFLPKYTESLLLRQKLMKVCSKTIQLVVVTIYASSKSTFFDFGKALHVKNMFDQGV